MASANRPLALWKSVTPTGAGHLICQTNLAVLRKVTFVSFSSSRGDLCLIACRAL